MGSMVSLWYGPSPMRDLEFLLLEENHCLTLIARHTTLLYMDLYRDEVLFVLFAHFQKLRPYGVGTGNSVLKARLF
jgi:hypothetical protein